MKWPCRTIAAACIVLGLACPSFAGQVKLEIRNGLVTLDARDATIREIFAEWARVGQTRVTGAERVPGGPVTLLLNSVPERRALEILLRSVAGFVAAPRAVAVDTASLYDRIMVMPVSRPAAVGTAGPAPSPVSSQMSQRERNFAPPNVVVDDQDEDPAPAVQMPVPGQGPGAPQPGMLTPNPQAPNQPASPNTPYGIPYGNPYPTAPAPGQLTPLPQSAARPGMPTSPPPTATKPPDPIIK
jgi:hypothetical protein